MTPYGHRQLGLVGAAFRIRDMYGEIIGDGYHSTPEAVNNFFHIKGADHAVMISDSLRPRLTKRRVYFRWCSNYHY